jgi:hypothetical protein
MSLKAYKVETVVNALVAKSGGKKQKYPGPNGQWFVCTPEEWEAFQATQPKEISAPPPVATTAEAAPSEAPAKKVRAPKDLTADDVVEVTIEDGYVSKGYAYTRQALGDGDKKVPRWFPLKDGKIKAVEVVVNGKQSIKLTLKKRDLIARDLASLIQTGKVAA